MQTHFLAMRWFYCLNGNKVWNDSLEDFERLVNDIWRLLDSRPQILFFAFFDNFNVLNMISIGHSIVHSAFRCHTQTNGRKFSSFCWSFLIQFWFSQIWIDSNCDSVEIFSIRMKSRKVKWSEMCHWFDSDAIKRTWYSKIVCMNRL